MNETDASYVKSKILERMVRHRFIGGKHTDINNLRKGFEKSRYREIDLVIDQLIRDNFLIVKITGYGKHISLNPKMLAEVKKITGL